VITGAASGLGAALARMLAAEGWQLAVVDLPAEEPTLQGIVADSPEAIIAGFDVRDAAAWAALHERLRAAWPALDLLVNAAGVGATGEVGRLPESQWRRVIDTNLVGTALGCETFLPWLREHAGRSHLVNVSSIAGVIAPPSMAAYAASKAGVIALSEAIAAECPARRPGVTVVSPGFFRSSLLDTWHFTAARESREAHRRMGATRDRPRRALRDRGLPGPPPRPPQTPRPTHDHRPAPPRLPPPGLTESRLSRPLPHAVVGQALHALQPVGTRKCPDAMPR
jgi:NAD(P)-dependent dehydrogenase (short-subunit alcohol dehydrogenase family)